MGTLETTSKRTDGDTIELTVSFSAEDVKSHIEAAYKEAGRVRIPGFRPGKAPQRVLENHYGGREYFLAQATDDLVNGSLAKAIDQEGYVPLDKPQFPDLDLVEADKSFAFTATFTVRPELALSSYDPVQIELPSEEPTPEEIESQIDLMLEYYFDFVEITDRPVGEKDYIILDLEISSENERIDALSGEGLPYELNLGNMPASFDEQLIGMKIGETKEFDFALNAEEAARVKGSAPSHAIATIREIKVKLKPELTDEWVKEKIEYDSVEDFKTRVSETLRTRKAQENSALKERLSSEELASRLEGEPTEMLLMQTEQELYKDFFENLQQSNQTFDSFLANMKLTPETFRENIKKQATQVATQALALDALARHMKFGVTEDEIKDEFETSGVENPKALFEQWKENGRLSEIRDGLLRMKASQQMIDDAEVFAPGKKPAAKKSAAKTDEKKPAGTAAKGEKKESTEKSEKPAKAAKPAKPAKAQEASETTKPDTVKEQ